MKYIYEYLEEDREKWKDRPYISVKTGGEFTDRTFSQVVEDAQALAKALKQRGIRGNIMIYSKNSYAWAVIDLALLGYAGVSVPIDKEWTAYDILNALSVIDVSAVFYEKEKQTVIDEALKVHPQIMFFCIEDCFCDLIALGRNTDIKLCGRKKADETAMILFTSGTTDHPKAIPLTQKNLLNNWDTLFLRTPMTETDSSYIFLPLNHVYAGVANFLYSIISGMRIYLCSDISKILEEMLAIRPTVVCTVPLILNRIYEAADERILDMLRAIRFLYCGGSFTDPDIKKYFIENGVTLLEAYGTTETSSVIALAKPGDDNIECNGVVMDNLDVKIVDADEDGVGEIIVGGGSVSSGYILQNGECSEFDKDGYYHTGDLGRLDDCGRLFLKGRKKRVIITANGKNIYADELENLILENPAVKSAVVFEENHHAAARIYTGLPEDKAKIYIESINQKLPKFKRIKNLYIKTDKLGARLK